MAGSVGPVLPALIFTRSTTCHKLVNSINNFNVRVFNPLYLSLIISLPPWHSVIIIQNEKRNVHMKRRFVRLSMEHSHLSTSGRMGPLLPRITTLVSSKQKKSYNQTLPVTYLCSKEIAYLNYVAIAML